MFVSIIPLLGLSLAVGSALGAETFADRIVAAVGSALTPATAALLTDALTSGTGRGGATALSLTVMGWSGLKMFRGIDVAFSQLYGTTGTDGFLGSITDGVAAIVGIGIALSGFAVVSALGAVVGVSVGLSGLALGPVLVAAFLPLYYLFPDRPMTIRSALPGTVVAAAGWIVLAVGFGLYVSVAGGFQLYGVIGGALLLVTWFYFAGQLLLVGAALNAVLVGVPDRQLQHDPGKLSDNAMSEDVDPDELTDEQLQELREEFESFREDVEDRTLHREEIEGDLRQYVRRKMRRGHARGWGPYVVLLYGTLMTLGGFYYLQGVWAVLAMLVIWLSTLGLYVVMVGVGIVLRITGLPGRLADRVRDWRD
jgi:YihY family inner membrane protein